MDDLLADFLTETHEGLLALDAALVRLERSPGDGPTLSEVFRLVHTIKGTCGFLGLPRLEAVAHAAENVLGRYRDGTLAVTQDGISRILQALDCIRGIVRALEATGAEPAGTDAAVIAALDAAAAGPAAAALAVAEAAPQAGPPGAPRSIRVSVEVLDNLMVLASELVLTRNQLLQAAREAPGGVPAAALQRLSRITASLQDGVTKTRMQPIGQAWARLPRLVRDLGIGLGKTVGIEMRGAGTGLDRQVLELVADPLTHMVRNAVDHGLETPDERRLAGKPEAGTIRLHARHEGGHVLVEVADDGRGLGLERIRARALAQGLATEAELAAMPARDIQRFVFRPGFSTAAAVTAVSGRGVGMDVVTANIERIGGTIEVRSEEGRGTTFAIRIPLTLAIVPALVVEAGGERFAIPQAAVAELVRAGGAGGPQVERIGDTPVLWLRGRLLPLTDLAALLRLDPRAEPAPEASLVVVAQAGAQAFGILVDRVFDAEEIVVKPVAPILRHLTVFSGNAILGDGGVIMVLDPNGVARAAGIGGAAEPPARAAPGRHPEAPAALLLFRAGDDTPKAVPLALVARLEEVARSRIESAGGRLVLQHHGRPMPLLPLAAARGPGPGRQPVLVLGEGSRTVGLLVDAILDVVEARPVIDPAGARPGYLGSAVIGDRVAEVVDAAWWLRQGGVPWPAPGAR